MLIVAWVMSDPVNCELMGRLVSTAFRLSRDDIRLLVRLVVEKLHSFAKLCCFQVLSAKTPFRGVRSLIFSCISPDQVN